MEPLSWLIATDFDLSVLPKYGLKANVSYGGWVTDRIPYTPEEMIKDINRLDADVLVVETEEVPAIVFEKCPGLSVVFSMRANPVNVDLESAKKHGVIVIHAPGRNAQAVAELTICLMLDILRKVSFSYEDLKAGNWGEGKDDPYLRFHGYELQNKTVGLVGLGAIGQAVARLLSGFQVKILGYDPYQQDAVFDQYAVKSVSLDELMQNADVISIHVPINNATRNLIGEKELQLVKPTAILVNTARAAVIERKALLTALEEKKIMGAALDVFYEEPPLVGDPLFDFPNVLYTPHIGGATSEVISRGAEMVVADLANLLNGNAPKYTAVNPASPRLLKEG